MWNHRNTDGVLFCILNSIRCQAHLMMCLFCVYTPLLWTQIPHQLNAHLLFSSPFSSLLKRAPTCIFSGFKTWSLFCPSLFSFHYVFCPYYQHKLLGMVHRPQFVRVCFIGCSWCFDWRSACLLRKCSLWLLFARFVVVPAVLLVPAWILSIKVRGTSTLPIYRLQTE